MSRSTILTRILRASLVGVLLAGCLALPQSDRTMFQEPLLASKGMLPLKAGLMPFKPATYSLRKSSWQALQSRVSCLRMRIACSWTLWPLLSTVTAIAMEPWASML